MCDRMEGYEVGSKNVIKTNIALSFFVPNILEFSIMDNIKLMKGKALRKHSLHDKA